MKEYKITDLLSNNIKKEYEKNKTSTYYTRNTGQKVESLEDYLNLILLENIVIFYPFVNTSTKQLEFNIIINELDYCKYATVLAVIGLIYEHVPNVLKEYKMEKLQLIISFHKPVYVLKDGKQDKEVMDEVLSLANHLALDDYIYEHCYLNIHLNDMGLSLERKEEPNFLA